MKFEIVIEIKCEGYGCGMKYSTHFCAYGWADVTEFTFKSQTAFNSKLFQTMAKRAVAAANKTLLVPKESFP